MENPLSKLALDHWYKVLMAAGLTVFLANGSGMLKAYPTTPVALVSIGAFFIGMGEWRNHPLQTALMPASAYRPGGIIRSYPRKASLVGIAFDLLGLCLVVFGLWGFWA